MCFLARVEGSRRGIIWSPAVSAAITGRATGLPKNPACTCCAGLAVSHCTSTGKSCATLAERTRPGESTCSTNQILENSWPRRRLGPLERGNYESNNPGDRGTRYHRVNIYSSHSLFAFRRNQAAAVGQGPGTKQKSISRRYRRRGTRTASQGGREVVCSLLVWVLVSAKTRVLVAVSLLPDYQGRFH